MGTRVPQGVAQAHSSTGEPKTDRSFWGREQHLQCLSAGPTTDSRSARQASIVRVRHAPSTVNTTIQASVTSTAVVVDIVSTAALKGPP
jgi:hypothetical protein